jgi:hypothetical protein
LSASVIEYLLSFSSVIDAYLAAAPLDTVMLSVETYLVVRDSVMMYFPNGIAYFTVEADAYLLLCTK